MEKTRAYYDRSALRLEQRKLACALDHEETMSILSSMPEGTDSVLDVGCGTGHLLDEIRCRMRAGVDFSASMLRLARGRGPGLHLVLADATHLPFRDSSFKVVTCQDVVGHLPDPGMMASEIVRCCAPQGRIIVTANARTLASRIVSLYIGARTGLRVRSYRPDELQKIFEVSGGRVLSSELLRGSLVKLVASPRE